MVERRGVFAVRLGGQVIPEPTIQSLLNLVYPAFVVNFARVARWELLKRPYRPGPDDVAKFRSMFPGQNV